MKRVFLLSVFCMGLTGVYSQIQNEFVLTATSTTNRNIMSDCKRDGHHLATVVFYTEIDSIVFETIGEDRIRSQKYEEKHRGYVLCLDGVDEEWRYIQIDIGKKGFRTYQMPAIQIRNGEFMAYNLSPKNNLEDKINTFSYIVPGLGQIELGDKTEGYAIIAGEALLLSGGVISSIVANKQLGIMRDVDVSLDDYLTAKNTYNTQKVINVTCYIGASALYGFHLYRVYHLSKKERENRYATLSPTILFTGESMVCGLSLNLNL